MRLFVALEVPSAVRERLSALIKELRGEDSATSKKNARWVHGENLHVTLKFIGQVDARRLRAIEAALGKTRCDAPVAMRFLGLGFFPDERRPRVLWAGVEGSANLPALAREIDLRLSETGIPRETRAFSPHLTLARFDPPGISEALRSAAQRKTTEVFGTARATEFHLYESKTRPTGAEYTRLSSCSFVTAEA